MNDHLLEHQIDNQEVFSGRLLKVQVDRVRLPNGAEAVREYIVHPGAVAVIAQTATGTLVFERQFRYPVGEVMLEIPAGKLDVGEPILTCAIRELREETGYEAEEWHYLGQIRPCIGYSDERIHYFLAKGLRNIGADLDDEEFLDVLEMSVADAYAATLDGRITDGKTIAGLHLARTYLLNASP